MSSLILEKVHSALASTHRAAESHNQCTDPDRKRLTAASTKGEACLTEKRYLLFLAVLLPTGFACLVSVITEGRHHSII